MLQGNEKEIIHGGQDFSIGKIIYEGVEIIPLKQWVSLQREQRRNYWYSYQGQNLTFLLYFTPVANWAPRKMFSWNSQ